MYVTSGRARSSGGARADIECLLVSSHGRGRGVVVPCSALECILLEKQTRRRRVRVVVHGNHRGVRLRGTGRRRECPLEARARGLVVVGSPALERRFLNIRALRWWVSVKHTLTRVFPAEASQGVVRAGESRPRREVEVRGATRERRQHRRAVVDGHVRAIRRHIHARRIEQRVEKRRERAQHVVHAEGEVRARDRVVRLGDAEERELRREAALVLGARRGVEADGDLGQRHGRWIPVVERRVAPGASCEVRRLRLMERDTCRLTARQLSQSVVADVFRPLSSLDLTPDWRVQ